MRRNASKLFRNIFSDARRHLESGDRDQALELIDAALAIDAKLLAASCAFAIARSAGDRQPDPAIAQPESTPVSTRARAGATGANRPAAADRSVPRLSLGRDWKKQLRARAAIEEIKS